MSFLTQEGRLIFRLSLPVEGEEDVNPGRVSRNTEWFTVSEGVGEFGEIYIDPLHTHCHMARKSRAPAKIQKAQRSLMFRLPDGLSYLDSAESLSKVNRKLFEQGMAYGIESVDFFFVPQAGVETVRVTAYTAGDTWSVHNSHVKGKALWHEMNQLVLEDNPSIEGKWADYKVFLNVAHRTQYIASGNLEPVDQALTAYAPGEWTYSNYVLPQHDVDPATGIPLAADECQAHLIGANLGTPGAFLSIGLVDAYEKSRATVSPNQPSVPAGMSDSFFNLLTDSGSQEPELADRIEAENDNAPYDRENYPGGAVNAASPVWSEFAVASAGSPNGILGSFVAQCGLVQFSVNGVNAAGEGVSVSNVFARVNFMPGKYKGIAAIPMGQ